MRGLGRAVVGVLVVVVGSAAGLAWTAGAAHADPLPAVYALPYTQRLLAFNSGQDGSVSVDYFAVQAPVVALEKAVNEAVRAASGANDEARWRRWGGAGVEVQGLCEAALVTNVVVSWRCGLFEMGLLTPREMESGGGPSGNWSWETWSYAVEGATLRKLALEDLFRPKTDIAAVIDRAAGEHVGPDVLPDFVIVADGLEFYDFVDDSKAPRPIEVPYAAIKAALRPGNPWERLAKVDDLATYDPDVRPTLPAGTTRFARAADGTVSDALTHLMWAGEDNGADLAQGAAAAFCKAYRGGGFSDWRLPWIDELVSVSDPADRHKPTGDCADGKYAFSLTPLIHASCGLAWSADTEGGHARAMGFVSGKPRSSPLDATKNYRALCVRGPAR